VDLVRSFCDLLQPFGSVMTAPTYQTLTWIVTGWIFAPRRTITGMMLAAGVVGRKHHSAFHRVFSAAEWSLDRVGLALWEQLSSGSKVRSSWPWTTRSAANAD